MTKGHKKRAIRKAIEEECPVMDYLEREKIISAWMAYPLALLEESLNAGFVSPENNPVVNPNLRVEDLA